MNEQKDYLKSINTTKFFYPKKDFTKNSNINSEDIYEKGLDSEKFWGNLASDLFWHKKWDKVCEKKPFHSKWFLNGKINVSYNCLDRHIKNKKHDKIAFYWVGENNQEKTLTYKDLYIEVNKLANALKAKGIKKGDRIVINMPMIPEAIVSMLACTRIGAVHIVIFGGTGPIGIKERIIHANAKLIITADGAFRRGKIIPYKNIIDQALDQVNCVKDVIVVKHCKNEINFNEKRDSWYHHLIKEAKEFCPVEEMDSEDMLFILYTSGSTGKPKGIFHTTAGYLLGVYQTTKWVFDIKDEDIYWSTADIGWITGHSYVVYGLLSNGATQVIYEGALDYPNYSRTWEIIEKYKVSIFYTAPTAVRTFMKWGNQWIEKYDLSSLRLLGSIGEPINPEVWLWYYEIIGKNNCPIVDTWFQTETGALVISALPGISALKPGSICKPLPGFEAKVLDEKGHETKKGFLALTKPFPSMLRGVYKEEQRYLDTYWSKWNGKYYYTGDGAYIDDDGNIKITGRLDDVIKVSGHRIGSAEVESALVEYPHAVEASVISVYDEIKGEKIIAFVILKESLSDCNKDIENELKKQVELSIGPYARPAKIFLVQELPKTKSGKIMRRILRNLLMKEPIGDISTLENKAYIPILKNIIEEIQI